MDARRSVEVVSRTGSRALFAARLCAFLTGAACLAYYDDRRRATETELESHRAALAEARDEARRRIADVESRSALELELARRSFAQAERSVQDSADALRRGLDANSERLAAQSKLLDALECRQESNLGRTKDDLEARLAALVEKFEAQRAEASAASDRFRAIQRRADGAVFLVHCAFKYEVREDDAWTEREATAWGTGFLATQDGILVTNKHLVQPWKFDADLRALVALGEARIKEDATTLAAWPVGEVCLDTDKKPLFENGFNTVRGDLAFVLAAPDRNVTRNAETFSRSVAFETHALDDRDLALLWIAGGPYDPLPIASDAEERALKKLDPVMTLGFPRGSSGLESSVAESSASLGVVRKIENTVQITAPIIAGNSGGPLLDERGRVVGVATRIYSETLGICIKAARVRELLADLERTRSLAYSAFEPSRK